MPKSRAGKVKIKTVKNASENDAEMIQSLFEQMTGSKNAEIEIILPKIFDLQEKIIKYTKVLNILLTFDNDDKFLFKKNKWHEEINNFYELLTNITILEDKLFLKISLEEVSNLSQNNMNEMYKELKNNDSIKKIIISTNNLAQFKKFIGDAQNLTDKFIEDEPGIDLRPLEFSNFNLKEIWQYDEIPAVIKKYILSTLNKIYLMGIDIYQIITSPDVDIKKFSEVIIERLIAMKKNIPRCEKAFKILENAVDTLEDNFTSYYKSSVEAKNPALLVEHFMSDLVQSKDVKASPLVISQFMKIANYFKQHKSLSSNPNAQKIIGLLNDRLSLLSDEVK